MGKTGVKLFFWRSMKFKLAILFVSVGIVLIISTYFIALNMVTEMEESQIADRLNADINYIEDLIGDGEWNIKDGAIYRGQTLVGDGTHENANLEPFLEHEEKTGTLSYVFIKVNDEGLGYVESTDTKRGYQEGHYLRVAGSTRDPDGKSIVGTYMDVLVADVLDKQGTYGGEANVAGGMIYCRYDTLLDAEGKVVGAIVVGRYIVELQAQVTTAMFRIMSSIVIAIIAAIAMIFLFVARWTGSILKITSYLTQIEEGTVPDMPLDVPSSVNEFNMLITGVNRMTRALRENEALRIKSETDQLTGVANRFGLSRYIDEFFEKCYRERLTIAVGIMDIDAFKPFNDNYGHTAGDACIVAFANVLKEASKKRNIFCARFGGDEFVVLFSEADEEQINEFAKGISDRVAEQSIVHEYSSVSNIVTVSQGYCFGMPEPYQRFNDYIHMADAALYDVKNTKKGSHKVVRMEQKTENGRLFPI